MMALCVKIEGHKLYKSPSRKDHTPDHTHRDSLEKYTLNIQIENHFYCVQSAKKQSKACVSEALKKAMCPTLEYSIRYISK